MGNWVISPLYKWSLAPLLRSNWLLGPLCSQTLLCPKFEVWEFFLFLACGISAVKSYPQFLHVLHVGFRRCTYKLARWQSLMRPRPVDFPWLFFSCRMVLLFLLLLLLLLLLLFWQVRSMFFHVFPASEINIFCKGACSAYSIWLDFKYTITVSCTCTTCTCSELSRTPFQSIDPQWKNSRFCFFTENVRL